MATLIFDMTDDFSLVDNNNSTENFYYCPSNETNSSNLKPTNFKYGYREVTIADADGFLRIQLEPVKIYY